MAAPVASPLPTKRPFESSPFAIAQGKQGKPWVLPPSGLAVFYGRPETPRLFHYFLPRLLAEGKQVLCLDGANRFDPLLIARLARQRGREVAEFNRRIRVARAFTCFQLTELLVRVPRLLEQFAADALVVTALPDLYFDEDVRERDAGASFRHALDALRALRPLPLGVAVFSDATSFETPRRAMFGQLAAQATELWRFALDGEGGGALASAVFSVFFVPSVVNAFQDLTRRAQRAQRKGHTGYESRVTNHGTLWAAQYLHSGN